METQAQEQTSVLDQTFSGIVYVGRHVIRSSDEPSHRGNPNIDGLSEFAEIYPEAYPHTFVDLTEGITLREILGTAGNHVTGSSGTVSVYQKITRGERGDATPAKVNAWRENFSDDQLADRMHLIESVVDAELDGVFDGIADGEPFVILDHEDPSLNVPKQPEDMRRALKEALAGTAFEGNFGNLDEKKDHEIRSLYESMESVFENL